MASYKNILSHVRKWEGGLVYHKGENQWTNRGVQWTTYKKLAPQLLGIDKPSLNGLKSMSESQADKFIEYFWNKATYNNKITNQATANAFFEMLWGGGTYGIKWLQKVLGLYPDGMVGKKTVAAANNYPPNALVDEVKNRYNNLAKSNPSKYGIYIQGWINRWNYLYRISKKYFNDFQIEDLSEVVIKGKKKSKIMLYLVGGVAMAYIVYKKIKK
jgi:lysozyme family protein